MKSQEAMEKVGFVFGRRCYLRPSLACRKSASPQKPTRVLHSTLRLLMFNPALRSVLGECWGESNNLLPQLRRCHPYAEETRGGGRLGSSLAVKVEGSIDYHRCRDLVPGCTLVLSKGFMVSGCSELGIPDIGI